MHQWLRRHFWMIGTGGVAAAVFAVTFVAVSAATDDDGPTRTVAAVAPTPPGVSAVDLPPQPAESPAAEPSTAGPPVGREVIDSLLGAGLDEEPPPKPLPEFDEESLIHGGSGSQGAILRGAGIVTSSGEEYNTPWELIVPSAQLRARVVKVGVTASGAFGAPDNPEVIGWWRDGAAPGERGNVLLDGHRDFTDIDGNIGTGVCWLLGSTQVGDFMIVRDSEAEMNYIYTVIETVSVVWNAPEGVEYLQPSAEPILTLITCEGSFDRQEHNYSQRRIVVAQLSDTIPFPSS